MGTARLVPLVIITLAVPLVAAGVSHQNDVRTVSVAQSETLTLRMNVQFDRSITSHIIRSGVSNESTAIWSAYGVELLWNSNESGTGLPVNVTVARRPTRPTSGGSLSILGHTAVDRFEDMGGPIQIFLDPVDALLQQGHSSSPIEHDVELGRALGRVLAHEIGHVLLGGPPFHDPDGLMRATFFVDDLMRRDRSRFQLADASVGRLRDHIARLSDARNGAMQLSEP